MDVASARETPCESMDYGLMIVDAGPAGLEAIRLKQVDASISVVVVEESSTV